jgi:predicted DNA-binding protein
MFMRYVSYVVGKTTKTELDVLAIAHQVSVEHLVREALNAHLPDIQADLRTERNTVGLDDNMLELLEESCDRTGLTKSKTIYLCIKKYLQENEILISKLVKTL